MHRDSNQKWLVFGLLVAIGIAGRWGQPQWSVTPLAATALLAGFYFAHRGVALLAPIVILTISNLALPQYDSLPVMASVYLAMVIPVFLGGLLKRLWSWPALAVAGPLAALVPSTAFYLLTNFAVWAFENHYPHTWAGLVECYAAGIPFYRWMAAGDLVYTAILFGCYAVARSMERDENRRRSLAATCVGSPATAAPAQNREPPGFGHLAVRGAWRSSQLGGITRRFAGRRSWT